MMRYTIEPRTKNMLKDIAVCQLLAIYPTNMGNNYWMLE